jgi:aspartate kinase
MKVFKFGGASVKDADGIRNLAGIVAGEKDALVVVVSAFGKTTNALENVLKAWLAGDDNYKGYLESIHSYHASVCNDLFRNGGPRVKETTDASFGRLKEYLLSAAKGPYDYEYDQVVSQGEIWSTIIVAGYLVESRLDAKWIDIRGSLITDDRYRDANILWDETATRVRSAFNTGECHLHVTQGFIGGTIEGHTTTLGREGSDYTAAILANILDAESLTVWKDVPGLLNADPGWLPDARLLDEMSYREAVEMTFSGAKVIHPKTIKPLHNKNIPLLVKSFLNPGGAGTRVSVEPRIARVLPVFVRKENQVLLSIMPRDFSFAIGENLLSITRCFMEKGIKVNIVEASAVSIDVCVDNERDRIAGLMDDLKSGYTIIYNDNVEVLSIRHYTPEAIASITAGREILLEQRTRSTVRYVVKMV